VGSQPSTRPKYLQWMDNEHINKFFERYEGQPKKTIAHLWYASLVLAVLLLITSIAVMAANGASDTGSSSASFCAFWLMVLLVLWSAGGTFIMRKHQNPMAIGFFLGMVVMASQTMFTLFVLFAGFAGEATDEAAADRWMCFFCFFSFLTYLAFSIFLAKFRTEIVEDDAGKDMHAVQQNLATNARQRVDIFGKEKTGVVGNLKATSKGTPV